MSGCSCIWVGDYEYPEFYRQKTVTGRKGHKCSECGRIIEKGEKSEAVSGKWDGDIRSYRTCEDCLSARSEFFCDGYLHNNMWENIWEHVCEHGGEIASECLLALTPRARMRVIEMIDELWEELNAIEEEEDVADL